MVLGDLGELAIAAAADRHLLLAPGGMARAALAAFAAALQREHRQPVANLDALHLAADLDHLAGVFVAQHHSHRHPEHRVLGDVQVRAADAAAPHLDDDVAGARGRIGQGLDLEGLAQRFKDGGFH